MKQPIHPLPVLQVGQALQSIHRLWLLNLRRGLYDRHNTCDLYNHLCLYYMFYLVGVYDSQAGFPPRSTKRQAVPRGSGSTRTPCTKDGVMAQRTSEQDQSILLRDGSWWGSRKRLAAARPIAQEAPFSRTHL